MLRRSLLALVVTLVACPFLPSPRAEAQGLLGTGTVFPNGGVDPFSFYYGYYLPHQAAIAAQPTPLDTINQVTAARQFTALSERQGLYDPISPYGEEDLDPNRPSGARRGGDRASRAYLHPVATSNLRGTGPATYYARTARYFPQLRAGKGPNRNLAVTKRGGMGMSGMGGGGAMGGGGTGSGGMAGPR
jgi:hypothetical protein